MFVVLIWQNVKLHIYIYVSVSVCVCVYINYIELFNWVTEIFHSDLVTTDKGTEP